MTSRVATQVITEPTKLAKAAPVFTLKEVAVHSTPTDCWVIVHGKVYDVSEFVPRHPGGSMIYVKAGGDCSQLFDSYHPLRAKYAARLQPPEMPCVQVHHPDRQQRSIPMPAAAHCASCRVLVGLSLCPQPVLGAQHRTVLPSDTLTRRASGRASAPEQ